MSAPDGSSQAVRRLMRSISPDEQLALRAEIEGDDYYGRIREIYLGNPFFRLTDREVAYFATRNDESLLNSLVVARDAASKSRAPKIVVFCMPKSGSSFTQSALRAALDLPFASLTSVGTPGASSAFGMNSREQELDELALVKSTLASPRGFVAQAHTRCSPYLAQQLRHFGIAPILTVRNILDCIVSFDDMMLSWRKADTERRWIYDAQFALPLTYQEMDDQARYDILARTFGTWLIAFYLSWRRCIESQFVNPVILRYEVDVLDPPEFVRKMSALTRMTADEIDRLERYVADPDPAAARLNVGVRGRGERIAESTVGHLLDYARQFGDELPAQEISYLIR